MVHPSVSVASPAAGSLSLLSRRELVRSDMYLYHKAEGDYQNRKYDEALDALFLVGNPANVGQERYSRLYKATLYHNDVQHFSLACQGQKDGNSAGAFCNLMNVRNPENVGNPKYSQLSKAIAGSLDDEQFKKAEKDFAAQKYTEVEKDLLLMLNFPALQARRPEVNVMVKKLEKKLKKTVLTMRHLTY